MSLAKKIVLNLIYFLVLLILSVDFSFIYSRSNLSYQLIKCTISPPLSLFMIFSISFFRLLNQILSIYTYKYGVFSKLYYSFLKLYTEIQPTESINVSNNQNKLSLICPNVNKKKGKFFGTVFRTCATTHLLFLYCIYVIKKILILDI